MASFGFGKSKSKSSSEPVDVTPQAFKDLQQPFADVLTQALGGGDTGTLQGGIPIAEGPFAAPVASGEQALLDQLLAKASGTTTSPSQDLLTQTVQGEFLENSPFLQGQIKIAQRANLQGLEELLTRILPGQFTQGGQFIQPGGSSPFDRARSLGLRAVADANADIAQQLAFQGFESERNRQQEAATALPQVTESEVNTLISNLQAQALPRLIEQFGLEAGTEAFNQQINALLQILAITSGTTQAVIGTESKGKSSAFNFNVGVLSGSDSGSTD